jgi:hypothetical protein
MESVGSPNLKLEEQIFRTVVRFHFEQTGGFRNEANNRRLAADRCFFNVISVKVHDVASVESDQDANRGSLGNGNAPGARRDGVADDPHGDGARRRRAGASRRSRLNGGSGGSSSGRGATGTSGGREYHEGRERGSGRDAKEAAGHSIRRVLAVTR